MAARWPSSRQRRSTGSRTAALPWRSSACILVGSRVERERERTRALISPRRMVNYSPPVAPAGDADWDAMAAIGDGAHEMTRARVIHHSEYLALSLLLIGA